jgi:hypothetical protein
VFFKGNVTTILLLFSPLPTFISPLVRRRRTRGLVTPSGSSPSSICRATQRARPRRCRSGPRSASRQPPSWGRPPPARQVSFATLGLGRAGRRALPWGPLPAGLASSAARDSNRHPSELRRGGPPPTGQASFAARGSGRHPGKLCHGGPPPTVQASSAVQVPARLCGRAPSRAEPVRGIPSPYATLHNRKRSWVVFPTMKVEPLFLHKLSMTNSLCNPPITSKLHYTSLDKPYTGCQTPHISHSCMRS